MDDAHDAGTPHVIVVRARPRRFLSPVYEMERDGSSYGEVEVAWFGRHSTMTVDMAEYDLVRTQPLDWELRRQGLPHAVASFGRDRAMSAEHRIAWDDRLLRIRPRLLRTRFDLLEDGAEVGSARPVHLLTNALVVAVPADLPGFVTALVVWSVVRMRRASAAAASGGA
jgi:hypothetical protein